MGEEYGHSGTFPPIITGTVRLYSHLEIRLEKNPLLILGDCRIHSLAVAGRIGTLASRFFF